MFNKRDKIKELQEEVSYLQGEFNDVSEERNKLKARLELYESDDYTKLTQLLRAELNMSKITLKFNPQDPTEQDTSHYFHGKTEEQIRNMLAEAYTIQKTPLFKDIVFYLVNQTGNYLALGSRSREDDILSRGEMLGTAKVFHEFNALAKQHEITSKQPEGYNNKEIL